MGQKVHPISLRLQTSNRYFESSWFSDKNYKSLLAQDFVIRSYLNSILKQTRSQHGRFFLQFVHKKVKIFFFNFVRRRRGKFQGNFGNKFPTPISRRLKAPLISRTTSTKLNSKISTSLLSNRVGLTNRRQSSPPRIVKKPGFIKETTFPSTKTNPFWGANSLRINPWSTKFAAYPPINLAWRVRKASILNSIKYNVSDTKGVPLSLSPPALKVRRVPIQQSWKSGKTKFSFNGAATKFVIERSTKGYDEVSTKGYDGVSPKGAKRVKDQKLSTFSEQKVLQHMSPTLGAACNKVFDQRSGTTLVKKTVPTSLTTSLKSQAELSSLKIRGVCIRYFLAQFITTLKSELNLKILGNVPDVGKLLKKELVQNFLLFWFCKKLSVTPTKLDSPIGVGVGVENFKGNFKGKKGGYLTASNQPPHSKQDWEGLKKPTLKQTYAPQIVYGTPFRNHLESIISKGLILLNGDQLRLRRIRYGGGLDEVQLFCSTKLKAARSPVNSSWSGITVELFPFQANSDCQSAIFLVNEIVFQLERREPFRRIKTRLFQKIANKEWIKGIRISCSGRLGGKSKKAQRSKTECVKLGRTSLHVFSSKIDFAAKNAMTPFGSIGVKVWVCYK